jgi:hypothetical protein
LRELADALDAGILAAARADWIALVRHCRRQQQLCEDLHRLLGSRIPVEPVPGPAGSELERIEAGIREKNRVYAAVLKRSRRTMEIMERAWLSSALTYSRPPEARKAEGAR